MIAEIASAALPALGSVLGKKAKNKAASGAADAQVGAAQMGIDEQRRQFDFISELLQPFVKTGTTALGGMGDLAGLGGAGQQQTAISALQGSPAFTSLLAQGENSILQNASATGGIRGGNTQAALAQFSPALLAQTINDQYSRLGGLAGLGQQSAVGLAGQAQQTGMNVTNLFGQQGAAQAGAALARGKNWADMYAGFGGSFGRLAGMMPSGMPSQTTGNIPQNSIPPVRAF